MKRQPTTQQISWFLDLVRNKQLDLNPPYQRKSVWSIHDKRFFLDTIFRNYPAPPIFIHRTIDDNGFAEYHVVDGKQRLETIISFANNILSIGSDFGDDNLNNKKINDLLIEDKRRFWDYTLVVDFIDNIHGNNIQEVFDRVNRNARNLLSQELRHARFNGWFINAVESESEDEFWWEYKISSKARNKRMRNVQFISELFIICIEDNISGFDQGHIDEIYAKYDDTVDLIDNEGFEPESIISRVQELKRIIKEIDSINSCISTYAIGSNNDFYTIWAALHLNTNPGIPIVAERLYDFFKGVSMIDHENQDPEAINKNYRQYSLNSSGASTDFIQRKQRLDALLNELMI